MTVVGALPDMSAVPCRIFARTFFGKQKGEEGFPKGFYSSPNWNRRFLNCCIGEAARITICSLFSATRRTTNIPHLRSSRQRSGSERRCYPEGRAIKNMQEDSRPFPLLPGQGKRARLESGRSRI